MSRFYQTFDLNSEIEKELLRASYLAQIVIDEFDLFVISKALFEALNQEINIEIIIISNSQKKSMKLVNLCKRLIDLEASIYWEINDLLFTKEDYFAIFDKEYLVCGSKQSDYENPETLLRTKNDFFNGLAHSSQAINLLSGDIEIEFNVDKSIVFSNGSITLKWETKNVHQIIIYPHGWEVEAQGTKTIKINEDIKFTLEGKNKDKSLRKSVFVRVVKENDIDFDVDVYDPILKDFIAIQPTLTEQGLFAAYLNQRIKLTWNIPIMGKLSESNLGKLPLEGSHEFILNQNETFMFTFKSINKTQTKKMSFQCFYDESLFEEDMEEGLKTEKPPKKESLNLQKCRSYLLSFGVKLFNIFKKKNI